MVKSIMFPHRNFHEGSWTSSNRNTHHRTNHILRKKKKDIQVCLKKLNDAENTDDYQVNISNRFAVLENLDDIVYNNRTWENV
jgi:hypothetical protein